MLRWIRGLALAACFAPMVAEAEEQPVVIELYTSQGCSACPPADELLGRLARMEGVLPLALHVDYWDYIGWKDRFAQPGFTKRQKRYARAAAQRTIYTPQMIVGGVDHVVGNRPVQVMELIDKHRDRADPVALTVLRDGDSLTIQAPATGAFERPALVQVVEYTPAETVSIERGENAGHTFEYHNIVKTWRTVGEWTGEAPLNLTTTATPPAAIILQRQGPGEIVAAARVD